MVKSILFFALIIPMHSWSQSYLTAEDYAKIRKYQLSDSRQCNPEQVIKSSSNLDVEAFYYYDGGEKTPLNTETDKRLLCLISMSTDVRLRGHLKSKPKGPTQGLFFKNRWPENAIVEEILFGTPMKFNLRCDDDGVPSVILTFTKQGGRLVRSISFTTSVLDCSTGELDNWLKPRPTWLK